MRSSVSIRSKTAAFSVILAVVVFIPSAGFSQGIEPILDENLEPKAYILVEASEGKILSEKNAKKAINVASTGKLVTALAAISNLNKDTLIDVPREAQEVQPTKIGMKVGEKWTRDDLLYALLLVSANDAAYALAKAVSGSIKAFEKEQQKIADELNLKHSSFGDPSGLDNAEAINGETKMSAYDLAIVSRAVLANPELSRIVSSPTYKFVGGDNKAHTLRNHNHKFLNGYEGANGMKTGFTRKSGRTLIATATRGETTLIAIVLNVYQTDAWAAKLLDEGFDKIENNAVDASAEKLPAIGVIGSKANVTILNEPVEEDKELAAAENTGTSSNGGGGVLSVEIITLVILATLITAVVLRRRVVKKRRKQRQLRALQMREMQRRSMIDVIDISADEGTQIIKR